MGVRQVAVILVRPRLHHDVTTPPRYAELGLTAFCITVTSSTAPGEGV